MQLIFVVLFFSQVIKYVGHVVEPYYPVERIIEW